MIIITGNMIAPDKIRGIIKKDTGSKDKKLKSGIKKINHFDVSDLPAKIAGYIENNPNNENYFNKSSI